MLDHHLRPVRSKALTGRNRVVEVRALGPSRNRIGDVRGMVASHADVDSWAQMPPTHRPGDQRAQSNAHRRRRDMVRILAVLLSLLALVLTSSALNWITPVQAADEGPKRAVIVSGPVHSLTYRYRDYARAMADAAAAQGMEVKRLFHPNATAARVKQHANGADLFVYVGHGNGWPSPYGPFQEDTKNGLGLNPANPDLRTTSKVIYKGANWLRANIEFAPNAVVILSHLSYASGNASSGMPIPTRSVAVERVDNFANGFLGSGARVVWALGWQPGADVIDALHEEDATMNAVFMTRYRDNVNPLNGWIGTNPGYYASVRVPGAEIHIDPHPTYGYLRGLTGDLDMTTTEWRDNEAVPDDKVAPVISELSASQAPATIATGSEELPVFTPNGDGISDVIKVQHTLSESAFLDVRVFKDGNQLRYYTVWSLRGRGATTWDGRRDDGSFVGDGRFRISITPRDRAGNVGAPESVRVKALTAMKAPVAMPALFDPADGDDLASTTILKAKLTRPATVSWVVRDLSGAVVRHGLDPVALEPGPVRFIWDGTDDAGQPLPRGRYTGRVRATTAQGSYGHDITIRMMPFRLIPSRWTLKRGETVKLVIETAEPVKGKPTVTANRKGLTRRVLYVKKINDQKFTAVLKTRRAGKAGDLKIRIASTDKGGGQQVQYFKLRLR